jgi:putative endonuclease
MKDIEMEVRFDVISVIKRNGKFEIEHIEDAFIAPVD